jgi:hypothetical protein
LPADLVAPDETGLDVLLEPLRVQQVGATPTGPTQAKPAPQALRRVPQASGDDDVHERASIFKGIASW